MRKITPIAYDGSSPSIFEHGNSTIRIAFINFKDKLHLVAIRCNYFVKSHISLAYFVSLSLEFKRACDNAFKFVPSLPVVI